jgi:hypothetical protein|tara:strand:+ start:1056 stop:1337 length:282 start_codon:yes stop_codon:yes gene_type:complete
VVTREVQVPGPERIIEVPGPERIIEVPGPERIVEKIVEVEKIIEVEKIVEVPVQPTEKKAIPNSWTFTPKNTLPVDNKDKDTDSKYYIKKPKN